MKSFFITGAGTGVGKTLVTAALAHQLRALGKSVRALKPVISGFSESDARHSDTGVLLAAQGVPLTEASLNAVSPWRFKAPISPDMAAEEEARPIPFDELVAFCKRPIDTDYLLIEGVGGVMVPLDTEHTVLDWALVLGFPVVMVTGSYLGSISHALASARVILSAGLPLHAVVVSASPDAPVPPERMCATLARFLPVSTRLCCVERLDCSAEMWKYVPDIIQSVAL